MDILSEKQVKLLSLCSGVAEYTLQKIVAYYSLISTVVVTSHADTAFYEVLQYEFKTLKTIPSTKWEHNKVKIYDVTGTTLTSVKSSVTIASLDITVLHNILIGIPSFASDNTKCCNNCNHACISCSMLECTGNCCSSGHLVCNHGCMSCSNLCSKYQKMSSKCCRECNHNCTCITCVSITGFCCQSGELSCYHHDCASCAMSLPACKLLKYVRIIHELRNFTMHLNQENCRKIENGDTAPFLVIELVNNASWDEVWEGFSCAVKEAMEVLNKYEILSFGKVINDIELEVKKNKINDIYQFSKDDLLKSYCNAIIAILQSDRDIVQREEILTILAILKRLESTVDVPTNKCKVKIVLTAKLNKSVVNFFSRLQRADKWRCLKDLSNNYTKEFISFLKQNTIDLLLGKLQDVDRSQIRVIINEIYPGRMSIRLSAQVLSTNEELSKAFEDQLSLHTTNVIGALQTSFKDILSEKGVLTSDIELNSYTSGSLELVLACDVDDYLLDYNQIVKEWSKEASHLLKRFDQTLVIKNAEISTPSASMRVTMTVTIENVGMPVVLERIFLLTAHEMQFVDLRKCYLPGLNKYNDKSKDEGAQGKDIQAKRDASKQERRRTTQNKLDEPATEKSSEPVTFSYTSKDERCTTQKKLDEPATEESSGPVTFSYVSNLIFNNVICRLKNIISNNPSIISMRDAFNWTLYHEASRRNRPEILTLLIDASTDFMNGVSNNNFFGMTPLMWASHHNYTECVRVLVQHGADVNVMNKYGKTAYNLTDSNEIKRMLPENMYGISSDETVRAQQDIQRIKHQNRIEAMKPMKVE